jgi:prephenate dehydrogenase
MWRDICIANRDRLLVELKKYTGALASMQQLLEAGDGAGLEKLFAEARAARDKWIQSS